MSTDTQRDRDHDQRHGHGQGDGEQARPAAMPSGAPRPVTRAAAAPVGTRRLNADRADQQRAGLLGRARRGRVKAVVKLITEAPEQFVELVHRSSTSVVIGAPNPAASWLRARLRRVRTAALEQPSASAISSCESSAHACNTTTSRSAGERPASPSANAGPSASASSRSSTAIAGSTPLTPAAARA